jgi:hypothetical protein
MSATVQTAQVGTYRTRVRRPMTPVAASVLGAMLAVVVVAGAFAISARSAGTSACIPRLGCETESGAGVETASFAAVGAAGASAIWFEMTVEPASPVLVHFLHPAPITLESSAFEPVSPALEHFLHPAPITAESWAFEPVSPALEHFLH